MAQWVQSEYGKGEIDRAGATLIPWWNDPKAEVTSEIGSAFMIVQNWRTSHGLPLNVFQSVLRGRAAKVQSDAIIAQRLKRFSSVMGKLSREPTMKLSQMQDLGGCRAILADVERVYELYSMYGGGEGLFNGEGPVKCRDYIKNPKADGYRGIHIIGRYSPRIASRQPWKKSRIEIQLRSRLQHTFATAVETVTTFTGMGLKFRSGPEDWARFFSLMGSALALREQTALFGGTPKTNTDLSLELSDLTKSLNVHQRLKGWTEALKEMRRKNLKGYKWLLLVLNATDSTIRVSGYANRREADKTIAEIEKSKNKNLDAVLVWVKSTSQLRAAYPNYYADTREFLEAVDLASGPHKNEV